MENKRHISILIPFRIDGSRKIMVYLQRRDKDAKRLPDYFGFFGGGIEEGEKPEQALVREIKEELDFNLKGYKFFGKYEFYGSIREVFSIKVSDDFGKEIKIIEGQYGKWFKEDEILREQKIIDEDKLVLTDFLKVQLQKTK